MSELLRVKTGSGEVTITETTVTVQRPGGTQTEIVQRATISGIEQKTAVMSLFGMGGAKHITIRSTGGQQLHLRVVKPKDAKAILAILP